MASCAVARETFVALRHKIAKIEGRLTEQFEAPGGEDAVVLRRGGVPAQGLLPLGAAAFDQALGGGIARAGLSEIHGAAMRDAAPTAGFVLALTALLTAENPTGRILWIATSELFREAGRPYPPGLAGRFGIGPQRLLIAEVPKPVDALWVAEEAANAAAFSVILLEMSGNPGVLDLTATRRLHRRALLGGHPIFLLREAGNPQPTAAPLRLVVSAAPAAARQTIAGPLAGSIGPPAFHVTIDKSRISIPASVTLEWNHEAFQERTFRAEDPRAPVSASVGRTHHAPAFRPVVAFPGARHHATAGVQPARKQHPARSGARRAG